MTTKRRARSLADIISYLFAIVSSIALVSIWFITTYKVVARKKDDVIQAENHIKLLQDGFHNINDKKDVIAAKKMIETSRQIYLQIEKNYNQTIKRPLYKIPSIIMGFRELNQK